MKDRKLETCGSISRIGLRAYPKLMENIAQLIRLDLAQAEDGALLFFPCSFQPLQIPKPNPNSWALIGGSFAASYRDKNIGDLNLSA